MLTVLVLCGSALLTAPGCDKSSEDSEADNGLLKVEATYVGSRKCRSCHETQYAGWTYSGHARVIQSAKGRPWIVHGDFTQPVYANNEMEKIDFKLEDVRYIHGVNWKQRYIDKDWRIRKVMWNYDDKKWHPYHQSDWKDRDWRKLCARCHTVGYDPDNHSFKEMGIGCESCHGPGSRHVKAPDVLKNTHIRNPAKMSHDAAAAVCGACHVRGKKRPGYAAAFPVGLEPGMTLNPSHYPQIPPTDKHWWPNGAAKGHHQQFIEWEQSGHRRAGLSCRHCHTPHKSSRRTSTRAARNRLCINCHTGVSTDPIRGHAPLAGAPQHFNCIGCHYPKIAKSATSGDITSHRGYIPPSETIKYAKEGKIQPNSCNACHAHADQTKPKNKPEYLQKSIDDARKKLTPIATMR
jgi:predicted CXXCH cytochrome family protein